MIATHGSDLRQLPCSWGRCHKASLVHPGTPIGIEGSGAQIGLRASVVDLFIFGGMRTPVMLADTVAKALPASLNTLPATQNRHEQLLPSCEFNDSNICLKWLTTNLVLKLVVKRCNIRVTLQESATDDTA